MVRFTCPCHVIIENVEAIGQHRAECQKMGEQYGYMFDSWSEIASEAINKGQPAIWNNYRAIIEHYKIRYGERGMAKRRKVNEEGNEGSLGERPKMQPGLSLFEELKQQDAIDMSKLPPILGFNPSLHSLGEKFAQFEEF